MAETPVELLSSGSGNDRQRIAAAIAEWFDITEDEAAELLAKALEEPIRETLRKTDPDA